MSRQKAWVGEMAAQTLELHQEGRTYAEIAAQVNSTPEGVRSFLRRLRNPDRAKAYKPREEEEKPTWTRKGSVFADPLLSALWLAHPEYRPPELISKFLPAIYVPKHKPKAKPKAKREEPVPEAARPIPLLSAPSRMEAIMLVVTQKYKIEKMHLISHRRNPKWAIPRQIAQYIAHEMTEATLPKIGRAFGGRDHTTILHAVRKMTARYEQDEGFRAEIAELKHAARQIECQRPWDE